ncbi:hypothetical protein CRM22_010568 [Opisthorchis felineus]|uniref:Domain of unknown function DB domain-containing protein n=1 Tax=Opisthorchis felineus TaxID=147828 RepID=A0A4S2KYH6_OPIFE|nr:hypothetical protein CRM22_010568 [Opisthorchis felineus]
MSRFIILVTAVLLNEAVSQNIFDYRACMRGCQIRDSYLCLVICSVDEKQRCATRYSQNLRAKLRCLNAAYDDCVAWPTNYADFFTMCNTVFIDGE